MGATLDALHRLQEIEIEFRSLRQQVEAKRRGVAARQRRHAALERQITETRQAIQHAQAEADRLELQRKTQEEHITKLREALNQAKTNKEYAAVLTQLNTDKADVSKVEDAALNAMGRVDKLKEELNGYTASLGDEQSRIESLTKAADDYEAERSEELAKLQQERDAAAADISPEALNLFARAAEAHDGEGLAVIERVHPKRAEYVCGGCNMSLTLETINALQSSADSVQTCNTCSRILYLDAPSGVATR